MKAINYISMLVGGALWVSGYFVGDSLATKEVESRVDTEHQQAIEDAVVCKLSLALAQAQLQSFEQAESERLQSCCTDE